MQGFDLATKPAQFFILLGGEPSALSSVYRPTVLPSCSVSGETSISLATFGMG